MIPNDRSITAALYCQQLDRVQESLRLNYPALVNRNQVVFLQDNAKPHTALLTRAKLDELGCHGNDQSGLEILNFKGP
jgi:hypothetical protein